jgi:alpha-L-glutamate ligase-like protein
MHWLFGARRLAQLGILGMNRRNAAYILDHNQRRSFPVVDDKLRFQALCARIGVPCPETYAIVGYHSQLPRLPDLVGGWSDFVVKPNHGAAGRGVLIVVGQQGGGFLRHNGAFLSLDELRQHLSNILSGMYSLGGRPDRAIFQQRVRLHPTFAPVCFQGIPDIRVVLYRGEPVMAMLRLPTRASNGRANLHQGGIGTGIDLATGITHHAVCKNRPIDRHPDTNLSVVGLAVPAWDRVLDMSRQVAQEVGLGYVGVDIVVDALAGPLLLEANARPGLAIQIANGAGLLPRLQAIDAGHPRAPIRTFPGKEHGNPNEELRRKIA